jgi:GAF domain-containing protein
MLLVATNGPLAGTALTLADGVAIGGPGTGSSEGRSCRITTAHDGGFVLHALDRQVPLFVNGLPVTTRRLEPRDELRIGDSLFIVRDDDPVPSHALGTCPVRMESASSARTLFELGVDEALLHTGSESASREGRDLATLLRVGAALSSIHGLAALDAALAGLLLDVVPADRIVFTGGDDGLSPMRSAWSARGASTEAVCIDPALIRRVVTERVAINVEIDGRHVIAAPMLAFARAAGTIWAETSRTRFDEGHVRLLLVVAALAAVAREQAREAARLQEAKERLQAEINLEHNMVGRSRPMRALFDRIARVARTDATILLRGESGTGKELVARAAHRNSARAERPFIAINCAAITESLLEPLPEQSG